MECICLYFSDKGVGWESSSLGYHGDEGGIFFESGDPMEQGSSSTGNHRFKTGDVIGVFLDAQKSTLSFYKNMVLVRNIQLKPHHLSQPLYATVSMGSSRGCCQGLAYVTTSVRRQEMSSKSFLPNTSSKPLIQNPKTK